MWSGKAASRKITPQNNVKESNKHLPYSLVSPGDKTSQMAESFFGQEKWTDTLCPHNRVYYSTQNYKTYIKNRLPMMQ